MCENCSRQCIDRCPGFCPTYISDNKVAGACTYATYQIRRFYEGEGEPNTYLPHAKVFAKHSKVINEGILEVERGKLALTLFYKAGVGFSPIPQDLLDEVFEDYKLNKPTAEEPMPPCCHQP